MRVLSDVKDVVKIIFSDSVDNVTPDNRWQVIFDEDGKTAKFFREFLSKALIGQVIPDIETLGNISVIVGSTGTQRIHHDVVTVENPVEHKDEADIMMRCNAPSLILIGMGRKETFQFGIQRDQIVVDSGKKKAIAINGDGNVLSVVDECDDLVTVEIQGGCMFTGDFQHAGVMAAKAESILGYRLQTLTDLLLDAFEDREHQLQV